MDTCDVVVLGGGIGGSSAATVLARGGLSVVVVEPTTEFPDIVRGEWMAPWGCAHAQANGTYEVLREAGGHHIGHHIAFDEVLEPGEAEAAPLPLEGMAPDIPGPLAIRHPVACQALADAAAAAGAVVHRGAEHIALHDDRSVSFTVGGTEQQVAGRMVIGADGRSSPTRKAVGIELDKLDREHFLGGILMDGLGFLGDGTVEFSATERDMHVLCFPQGEGRARIYLSWDDSQAGRFGGTDRVQKYVDAMPMACWPGSDGFLQAEVSGPAIGYRSVDSWTDRPFADGVVLVGDAAGHSDPIIGQGLSVTQADVRAVTQALLGSDDWSPGLFEAYGQERMERMRRLRAASMTYAHAVAGHYWAGDPHRRVVLQQEELTGGLLATLMVGPELMPAEVYDDGAVAALLADPVS